MADIKLADFGDGGYGTDRCKAQTVAGMAFEPRAIGKQCGFPNPVELARARITLRVAIAAHMQFNHWRADGGGGGDLDGIGIDKQGHPDTRGGKPFDKGD